MKSLTSTQKIKLHDLHGRQMVNDHAPLQEWDVNYFSGWMSYAESLGLSMQEAEALSWGVSQNYYSTLLAAIHEGYSNEHLTPETIAYIAKQAAQEKPIIEICADLKTSLEQAGHSDLPKLPKLKPVTRRLVTFSPEFLREVESAKEAA